VVLLAATRVASRPNPKHLRADDLSGLWRVHLATGPDDRTPVCTVAQAYEQTPLIVGAREVR
jgi:hypothetical protein